MTNQALLKDFERATELVERLSEIETPLSAVECVFFTDGDEGVQWPEAYLLRFGDATARIDVDDDTCEIKLSLLASSQCDPETPVSHQPPWNRLIGTKTSWCWCMFNNMWCPDGVEIEFDREGSEGKSEIVRFVGLPGEIQVSTVTPFSRGALAPHPPSSDE